MGKDLLYLPLKIILIALDLTITLITFGWISAVKKFLDNSKGEMYSVPVDDNDESHRVDPRFKGKLVTTPRKGVSTLYELASDAFHRYADRPCMGTREYLGQYKGNKKIKHFGPAITWRNFEDVGVAAHKFGAALKKAGMVAAPDTTDLSKVTAPCRMAIFENTCAEWMIACMGAYTQAMAVTTVYATLGIDAVTEAVRENSIKVMLCNKKDVAKLVGRMKDMPTLTHIIYTSDLIGPNDDVTVPAAPANVKIVSFEDFLETADTKAFPPTPPKVDTCAVVMYTSGSTGKPKGVIITHRQLVATIGAGDHALRLKKGEDRYLAYLPLAHIMELMAEFCMISSGCTLCYADPKSLSTTGAYPTGALEAFSPTLMVAVPKVWDVIKKGVLVKMSKAPPLLQVIANTALEWKVFCLPLGLDTPLFNALVFRKMKQVIGGKMRRGISGGGPLSGEVQLFIQAAFGFKLGQGYGLTETCAGLSFQDEDDLRTGIVGQPIASAEVKLESTPDVKDKHGQPYLSTDRVDVNGEPTLGRGEICVRGAHMSLGYYCQPEKTAESYKDGGWFLTGDIGQFTADGCLKIVDRKKNLLKLKGGEYIALEQMEMTYGNSTYVDALHGGICCYGDGEMDRPVALMQLSEPAVMSWAAEHGIAGDFATVRKSKELYDAVMEDMKKEHAKGGLSHLERLVAVGMLTEPWTPENGCLTAANKLNRQTVIAKFDEELKAVRKKAIFD